MSSPLVFPRPAVDGQTFAQAAARLAGSVAIVTWPADTPQGVLVGSVSLLSTRPPRVLFAVGKDEAGHAVLLQADACTVNLLSEADATEADRFARAPSSSPPFSADRWTLVPGEAPRLSAGAAHLSGVIDQRIDAGSHSLFVVRVEDADVKNSAPLVYFDRAFRRLAQPSQAAGAQVYAMMEA